MIATKRAFGMLSALVLVMLVQVTMTTAQRNNSPEALMQRAIQKEMVDGDPKAALDLYERVADTRGVSPALAADALVGMGRAYESLGNREAQKAYDRVIQDYAGQAVAVATAQARLKALGVARSTAAIVPRGITLIESGNRNQWKALTPDGRYLLSVQGNMRDLVTEEESRIPLSEDCRFFQGPAVSRDGKLAHVCDIGRGWEMRIVSLNGPKGAAQAKVLMRTETNTYFEPFGWSLDSKEVFAIVEREQDTTVIAAISISNGSLRIIKPLDFFAFPRKMSVSPDGRYLAYDAPTAKDSPANKDIFVLATDGSGDFSVLQDPAMEASPVWTPDGKALLFLSDRAGTWGIWKIPISAGKPQGTAELLRRNTGELNPIGFASDGSFYYAKEPSSTSDIYTAEIDLAGGTVTRTAVRAVEQAHGHNENAAYSPDGKSLAYVRRTGGSVSIVIRTLGTEKEQEIPTTLSSLTTPIRWFPDGGRSLFFAAYSPYDGYNLRRLDLETGKDLMIRKIGSSWATASPDGKTIYYVDEASKDATLNDRLLSYQLETQRETELFRAPRLGAGGWRHLLLSPDGQQIAFRLFNGSPEKPFDNPAVAMIPTSGGSVTKLRSIDQAPTWGFLSWSPDGKKILAQKANGELWWIMADGGEPQRIGQGTFPAIDSIHPDGKQIAITHREASSPAQYWADPELLRSKPQANARRDNR